MICLLSLCSQRTLCLPYHLTITFACLAPVHIVGHCVLIISVLVVPSRASGIKSKFNKYLLNELLNS